jgi:hypothetical protein
MESQALNQLEQRIDFLLKRVETLEIEKNQLQQQNQQQNSEIQIIKGKSQATAERIKNILNKLKQPAAS